MPAETWRADYQFLNVPTVVGNNGGVTRLSAPQLSAVNNDRMAIVYETGGFSNFPDVIFNDIRLRIADPFGNRFDAEVTVAAASYNPIIYTGGTLVSDADVATLSDGKIVVTYNRETWINPGLRESEAMFRIYNADGTAVGGEQILNINALSPTNGQQSDASIAAFSNGTFAAVWTETVDQSSSGGDGAGSGIYLQRFGGAAQALGGLLRVNTTTSGDQKNPSITTLSDGNVLVAWSSGDSIYGQRISTNGALVGSEALLATVPVGAGTGSIVVAAKVVALTGGGFALAWEYDTASPNVGDPVVEVQIFNAAGATVGNRHVVQSTAIAFTITSVDAAATTDGGVSVVVGWSDFLTNTLGLTRSHVLADGTLDEAGAIFSASPGVTGATGGAVGVFADGREILMWDRVEVGTADTLNAVILDGRPTSLYGSAADDVIVGGEDGTSRAHNVIVALSGNDTAHGMGGQDYLYMGDGDDVGVGGAGVDVLLGEAGNDTLYGGDDTDYIFSGAGTNNVLSGDGGVDALYAEGVNDVLYGGLGGDYFYAYPGAISPTAFGGDGNDIYTDLSGGAGTNDIFYGEVGQDYMYGFGGNDTFYGGTGVDVFSGGDGDDVFDGGTDTDYAWGGSGNDRYIMQASNGPLVINDFVAGGADDSIALAGTGLSSFAAVQAAMTYYAAFNTTILTIDADTSVWFVGVNASQFTAADFTF